MGSLFQRILSNNFVLHETNKAGQETNAAILEEQKKNADQRRLNFEKELLVEPSAPISSDSAYKNLRKRLDGKEKEYNAATTIATELLLRNTAMAEAFKFLESKWGPRHPEIIKDLNQEIEQCLDKEFAESGADGHRTPAESAFAAIARQSSDAAEQTPQSTLEARKTVRGRIHKKK